MEDIATLYLQVLVRMLIKQMDNMKKVMKEPPSFDGISLDLTICLGCALILEDYFQQRIFPVKRLY